MAPNFIAAPLKVLIRQIAAGNLKVQVGKIFKLGDIVRAHCCMEENRAGVKIVVLCLAFTVRPYQQALPQSAAAGLARASGLAHML